MIEEKGWKHQEKSKEMKYGIDEKAKELAFSTQITPPNPCVKSIKQGILCHTRIPPMIVGMINDENK